VHLKMPREIAGDDVEEWSSPLASRTSNHWAQQAKFPESVCSSSNYEVPPASI